MTASLKFRTESLLDDMPTTRLEYFSGRNTRVEQRNCQGRSDTVPPSNVRYEYGPLRAYVHNRDQAFGFEIDFEAEVYTAWRANFHGSPVGSKPARIASPRFSGLVVDCHSRTVDTGDRRTIFGYLARRVLVETSNRRDGEVVSESESEGWYIDAPAAWLQLHPPGRRAYFLASGAVRDEYRFIEEGERETGFPMLVKDRRRSYFLDANGVRRSHENSHRNEVTEFSEEPLDPRLFLPPPGFRRVAQLPGGYRHSLSRRIRMRWEMLKDARALRKAAGQARSN